MAWKSLFEDKKALGLQKANKDIVNTCNAVYFDKYFVGRSNEVHSLIRIIKRCYPNIEILPLNGQTKWGFFEKVCVCLYDFGY